MTRLLRRKTTRSTRHTYETLRLTSLVFVVRTWLLLLLLHRIRETLVLSMSLFVPLYLLLQRSWRSLLGLWRL